MVFPSEIRQRGSTDSLDTKEELVRATIIAESRFETLDSEVISSANTAAKEGMVKATNEAEQNLDPIIAVVDSEEAFTMKELAGGDGEVSGKLRIDQRQSNKKKFKTSSSHEGEEEIKAVIARWEEEDNARYDAISVVLQGLLGVFFCLAGLEWRLWGGNFSVVVFSKKGWQQLSRSVSTKNPKHMELMMEVMEAATETPVLCIEGKPEKDSERGDGERETGEETVQRDE
ncbi:hypothetical protein QYF36_006673 [Acer negundo]|nr:hypothetical protein QYF36_006673 [Acer negundo]